MQLAKGDMAQNVRTYSAEDFIMMDFILDLGLKLVSSTPQYTFASRSRMIYRNEEISFNGHTFGKPCA